MTFTYSCPVGHAFEHACRPMDYQAQLECPDHSGLNTPVIAERDIFADLHTVTFVCDDTIRRGYNSAKIEHQLALQGRPMDPLAPRDKFEAKHIEKATGRVYIGDDYTQLSAAGQKAIEKGKRQKASRLLE